MIRAKFVSSMEKCFLDTKLDEYNEFKSDVMLKNEKYFFQLAWTCGEEELAVVTPVVSGKGAEYVTVHEVVNIPSEMPTVPIADDNCLRTKPGLYPDLLRPLMYGGRALNNYGNLRALMFEFDPKGNITGEVKIKVELKPNERTIDKPWFAVEEGKWEDEFTLNIIDAELPKQELLQSRWFYADCLADYYNVPALSDKHFEICEKFVKKGVEYGINMWMVPLMTYALDTYIGGERTTVQLVDVYKNGDEYTFGYENLDRWLDMYARCGVEEYEITHFYSQWGVLHTPKVMAYVDGEYKKIFGWETDSLSEEYVTFLRSFIKGFIGHMKARGEDKKCWFHISDEPTKDHAERYKAAKDTVSDLLEGYHMMDALSDYKFYEEGIVETPVPHIPHLKPFLENNVPDLWCYYCGMNKNISQGLFAYSLPRARYIGTQLFAYNIKGFLNWGYNFYNTLLSYDHIDPFHCSDGALFVPSGDTYIVYPGKDGDALPSLRLMAFHQGLQDLRAMNLCASLYSKDFVLSEIEKITGKVVFDRCLNTSREMNVLRKRIYELIQAKA